MVNWVRLRRVSAVSATAAASFLSYRLLVGGRKDDVDSLKHEDEGNDKKMGKNKVLSMLLGPFVTHKSVLSGQKQASRGIFTCTICPKKCDSANDLKRHYNSDHSKDYDWKNCKTCKCGARFPEIGDYKRHKNDGDCPLLRGESLTTLRKRKLKEMRGQNKGQDEIEDEDDTEDDIEA